MTDAPTHLEFGSVPADDRDQFDCEEHRLVVLAQGGDQRAFRELYRMHANAVMRYAILPLVRDRTLGEDMLADTFVRAMENLHRFRWQGKSMLPWLIRISKNLCLDYLRKSGRRAAWPEGLEQKLPDPTELTAEKLLSTSETADLLKERIECCLTEMNPRYRKVLTLRLIEKRPRAEAAVEMEVTVGTLDVLLFRACKAFRKVYERFYGSRKDLM